MDHSSTTLIAPRLAHRAEEAERVYRDLGAFVTAAADLDLLLSSFVGLLFQMSPKGYQEVVLHAIPTRQKLELAKSGLRVAPKELSAPLGKMVDRIEALWKKRDAVIHGILGEEEAGGELVFAQMTLGRVVRWSEKRGNHVKASDLPGLITECRDLIDQLLTRNQTART